MHRTHSRVVSVLISVFTFVFPLSALSAVNTSELHILPDGSLTSKSVVVYQKAGSNFFCRVAWGDTFIRMTVLVHADTEITKKFGGKATVDEIKEGDTLEIVGILSDGTGNLVVKAKKIKNLALTAEAKTISGLITRVSVASSSLAVNAKGVGAVQVVLSPGGVIQKGARTIALTDVGVGDTLLGASGVYNFSTLTLTTSLLEIFQDKKMFAPKAFAGTIESIAGASLPTSITMTSSGKTYTVALSQSTKLMSKSRATTSLSRMVVGDSILVYGSIKETNLSEISAISVRDLAF